MLQVSISHLVAIIKSLFRNTLKVERWKVFKQSKQRPGTLGYFWVRPVNMTPFQTLYDVADVVRLINVETKVVCLLEIFAIFLILTNF